MKSRKSASRRKIMKSRKIVSKKHKEFASKLPRASISHGYWKHYNIPHTNCNLTYPVLTPADEMQQKNGSTFMAYVIMLYLACRHSTDCIVIPDISRRPNKLKKTDISMRWIQINPDCEGYISVPIGFWEKMKDCLKRNPRFITFPFGFAGTGIGVSKSKSGPGHANYMIYDTKLKTLERFDPTGTFGKTRGCETVDIELDNLFRKEMGKDFVQQYYPPHSFMSESYWQHFEKYDRLRLKDTGPGGFCVSWSAFYADARMSNPDLDRNQLGIAIHYTLRTDFNALSNFIKSYTAFLEKVKREYIRTENMEQTFLNVAAKCKKTPKILQ